MVRAILTSIILCLTLTACGTKGPLYLPEKQYPQDQQSTPKSDPKHDTYE